MRRGALVKPYSPYLGVSSEELKEMLQTTIGIDNALELFSDIPDDLILKEAPKLPVGPMTEPEIAEFFTELAKLNKNPTELVSFLGGGVRQIYIPAFLDEVIRRGELYTAYTAYQPEVAQGMLQLLFEYQSLMAELTGMNVVNASMYDWSTAAGEAALMSVRLTGKKNIVIASPISLARRGVLHNYLEPQGIKIVEPYLEKNSPFIRYEELKKAIDENTAAVYLEMPNALGYIDPRAHEIGEITHEAGAKFVVGVDALSLGLLKPPAEYNADIVVGEGQAFGNAPNYGGPLLGIFAFNYDKKDIRRAPGKLIGMTQQEKTGEKGFTITLQAREQHIRRAKATSNICTNESLTAAISAIYLSALGPKGFKELSLGLHKRAQYLKKKLQELEMVQVMFPQAPFFADFSVRYGVSNHKEFIHTMIDRGFVPGYPWDYDPSLFVLGVSELHTRQHFDRFANTLKEVLA